jgi:integrase
VRMDGTPPISREKGGKAVEQELYPTSVAAARDYFKAQFHRDPSPGDYFFYTLENYKGRTLTPLKSPTLWARIREIGFAATKVGVIVREIEFSPHLFRRTFATLYYRETRDLKVTQIATRHSSVEVLMKHCVDSAQGTSEVVSKILG